MLHVGRLAAQPLGMVSSGIEALRGLEKLVVALGGGLLGERWDRHLWFSDVLLR